jgi:hypothetical protein
MAKPIDYAAIVREAKRKSQAMKEGIDPDSIPEEDAVKDSEPVDIQPVNPSEEKPPESAKEPEKAEQPIQTTPFDFGNNDADLQSFAGSFDTSSDDIVDVEPEAVDMPKDIPLPTQPSYDPDDDKEEQPRAGKTPFPKPPASIRRDKRKSSEDAEYDKSHLRAVPTSLVQRARYLFPKATNNDEAVGAYIYFKEGCPADLDVPERFKEVAKSYIGETVSNEDLQNDILQELNRMRAANRLLMQKIDAVELATAYNLFDRMGFDKGSYPTVHDVAFMSPGLPEFLERLETASVNYQTRLKLSEGRTKR